MKLSNDAFKAVNVAMNIAGNTITYNRDTSLENPYNVDTGDYTPVGAGTDPFVPVTGKGYCDMYKVKEIDNIMIQQGDIKLYSQIVSDYVPKINDTAEANGTVYRVMNVETVQAENGIVVMYILQLRQ